MNSDPLAELKAIHLPAAPDWFPPAPGWWLSVLAALLVILAIIVWIRRRQQQRAPLKQALAELDSLQAQQDNPALMQELNHLLRRAARQAHGLSAASLGASDWAAFLSQHAPADLPDQPDIWQTLAMAPYSGQQPARYGDYLAYTRAWLRSNLSC